MVKQVVRKGLTQCQHCWKSRLEGVSLSKCGACQSALYCSKECQKAGWPAHKALCRLNSAQRAAMPHQFQTDSLDRLRAFCAKHRPSFARFGMHAFDLTVDVTRCLREVLIIRVVPNPFYDGKKAERAFLAIEAELIPIDVLGEKMGRELREQVEAFYYEQEKRGSVGGFNVVVSDMDSKVSNACGVGFGKASIEVLQVRREWKDPLLLALNTGTVF